MLRDRQVVKVRAEGVGAVEQMARRGPGLGLRVTESENRASGCLLFIAPW
jgi:hypothetical protein